MNLMEECNSIHNVPFIEGMVHVEGSVFVI